jgi:hypothetical protein
MLALMTSIGTFIAVPAHAARSDTNKKVITTRNFKKQMKVDLAEINGKLDGYATFIAYHVSADVRSQLFDRLRAARMPKPRKHNGQAAAVPTAQPETQAATAVAALPAIPTVPATVVPQTGEHPQISATA